MSVCIWHTRLRINDLYRHLVDFEIKFDFVINSQKIKAVNESIHFKICVPVFILNTAIFYTTYMPIYIYFCFIFLKYNLYSRFLFGICF